MSRAYVAVNSRCGHVVAASVIDSRASKAEKRCQAFLVSDWLGNGRTVSIKDVTVVKAAVWCPPECTERTK